jgi:PhoPQ-activated pathogenicity-related protein
MDFPQQRPSGHRRHCQPAIKEAHLWTADSADRDLRDDKWTSQDLTPAASKRALTAPITTPESGYRAYLAEIVLTSHRATTTSFPLKPG